MAAADSTTFGALLKEVWPQSEIYDELLDNMPAYALIKKGTDFYEKVRHVALGYGATQGAGADFTLSKANKQPSKESKFDVTTVTYYSLFSVTRKLIRQSQNRRGAIAAALERESGLALKTWKRDMGILLYRTGIGDIGQVSAISTNTFTLVTAGDARNYEINMTLQWSSDNTGAAGVRTGTLVVSGVNYETGVVTCTANITTGIPQGIVNDYVYRAGNYNAVISGFNAWVPSTDPGGGDSFFNVNRSTSPQRLAGVRKSVTGFSPREQQSTLALTLFNYGGSPSHSFLNTADYLNLMLELQAAGVVMMTKELPAKIDGVQFGSPFDGISLPGPSGVIKIFPDYNCQSSVCWMLQLDTWTLAGTGDFPYVDAQDGNRILREESADAYEGRIVGDLQLYCEAPAYNVRGGL